MLLYILIMCFAHFSTPPDHPTLCSLSPHNIRNKIKFKKSRKTKIKAKRKQNSHEEKHQQHGVHFVLTNHSLLGTGPTLEWG